MDIKCSSCIAHTFWLGSRCLCIVRRAPSPSPPANGRCRVHVRADPSSKPGGSGDGGSLQDHSALPGQSHKGLTLTHTHTECTCTDSLLLIPQFNPVCNFSEVANMNRISLVEVVTVHLILDTIKAFFFFLDELFEPSRNCRLCYNICKENINF